MKLVSDLFVARGATSIEYALIAAGIAITILVAVNGIGTTMNSRYATVRQPSTDERPPYARRNDFNPEYILHGSRASGPGRSGAAMRVMSCCLAAARIAVGPVGRSSDGIGLKWRAHRGSTIGNSQRLIGASHNAILR
jgi:pilus assembly protein Flp/PilA